MKEVEKHKTIAIRRFREACIEHGGWDLSQIKSLYDTFRDFLQPYIDNPAFDPPVMIKAQLFRDWFRTKSGAHNDQGDEFYGSKMSTEMQSVVDLLSQWLQPLDPNNKKMDLGSIMLAIFKEIL